MYLSHTLNSRSDFAESTFKGVGGVTIFTHSWLPEAGSRAAIVIAHGFNSHSGHYAWAAEQFVLAGFAVHAMDHRGRGKSGGERAHVDAFADYVDDLATFVRVVKARQPGLPVFLLGHSAGGVISALYALDQQSELAGLISESSALQVPAPAVALATLNLIGRVMPHLRLVKLKNEDFSSNPEIVRSRNRDPLIAGERQTAKAISELIAADEQLKTALPRLALPLLILHGTEDEAASPGGSQLFFQTAGSKDKTLKLYPGAFHDLLNDLGRETVTADIIEWIDTRLAANKPLELQSLPAQQHRSSAAKAAKQDEREAQ
ncbi:alpha/beta hydrolase [Bradyrhizobium nanningense]|uniref:alpha/beta hydrolase n=1 Tax=Bradyrhizobium nanningense TaxID=1325118 RepID=UPI0010088BD8|nr:alpha/beta hydrolase [Bradyrhizobium nanningense]